MTTRKQKWEGKQLYDRLKRLINNISHQKTWTWLRKGNLKRETEPLLIAAQDNSRTTIPQFIALTITPRGHPEDEDEGGCDTDCNWCTRNNIQRIGKKTGRLGYKRASGDNPDYSIIKIDQNIEKMYHNATK